MELTEKEIEEFYAIFEKSYPENYENESFINQLQEIEINRKIILILKLFDNITYQNMYNKAIELLKTSIDEQLSELLISVTTIHEIQGELRKLMNERYSMGIIECYSLLLNVFMNSPLEWEEEKQFLFNCMIGINGEKGIVIGMNVLKNTPYILNHLDRFRLVKICSSVVGIISRDSNKYETYIIIIFREMRCIFTFLRSELKRDLISDLLLIIIDLISIPIENSVISEVHDSFCILIQENMTILIDLIIVIIKKFLSIIKNYEISDFMQSKLIQTLSMVFEYMLGFNILASDIFPEVVVVFTKQIDIKYSGYKWKVDQNADFTIEDSFKKIIFSLNNSLNYLAMKSVFESLRSSKNWQEQSISLMVLRYISKVNANHMESNLPKNVNLICKLLKERNHAVVLNCIFAITDFAVIYKSEFLIMFHKSIFSALQVIATRYSIYPLLYNSFLSCLSNIIEHSSIVIVKLYYKDMKFFFNRIFEHQNHICHDTVSAQDIQYYLKFSVNILLKLVYGSYKSVNNIFDTSLHIGGHLSSSTFSDIYIDWLNLVKCCTHKIFNSSGFTDIVNIIKSIDFPNLMSRNVYENEIIKYLEVIDDIFKYHPDKISPMVPTIAPILLEIFLILTKFDKINIFGSKYTLTSAYNIKQAIPLFKLYKLCLLNEIKHFMINIKEIFYITTHLYLYTQESKYLDVLCDILIFSNNYVTESRDLYEKTRGVIFNSDLEFDHDFLINISICYNFIIDEVANSYLIINEDTEAIDQIQETTYWTLKTIKTAFNRLQNLQFILINKLKSGYIKYFTKYAEGIITLCRYVKDFEYFEGYVSSLVIFYIHESDEIVEIFREDIIKSLKDDDLYTFNLFISLVRKIVQSAPEYNQDIIYRILEFFETNFDNLIKREDKGNIFRTRFATIIGEIILYYPNILTHHSSLVINWIAFLQYCNDNYSIKYIIFAMVRTKLEYFIFKEDPTFQQLLNKILSLTQIPIRNAYFSPILLNPGSIFIALKELNPDMFENWQANINQNEKNFILSCLSNEC